MLTLNPVCIAISFLAGSGYSVYLNGWRKYLKTLRFVAVIVAIISDVGVNLLIDVRNSEETRSSDEMRVLAHRIGGCPNFMGRCAMLVPGATSVRYGLARMLAAFAEADGHEFVVFTDEAEALAWLEAAGQNAPPEKGGDPPSA